MVDIKKHSFADKLKKGGFKGRPDSADGGFAQRFRPEKSKKDVGADIIKAASDIKDKKLEDKSFANKKNVKKSSSNDLSCADRVRRGRSQNVFLVRGKDRGRAAWHYVLVDNNKRELFLAATKKGSLDIADYGEVLQSGWGQDPPENIVKKIEDEFN